MSEMAPMSGFEVDLTNCDREPIHILGSVQPFGFLLAVNSDWLVVHASTTTLRYLGAAPEAGKEVEIRGDRRAHAPIAPVARDHLAGDRIDARCAFRKELACRRAGVHGGQVPSPGAAALCRRRLDGTPGLDHGRLNLLRELDCLLKGNGAALRAQPGCRDARQDQQRNEDASHAFQG